MTLYYRTIETGGTTLRVEWEPENTDTGKTAIKNVLGEPDAYPVEVTEEEADQVQKAYVELTA